MFKRKEELEECKSRFEDVIRSYETLMYDPMSEVNIFDYYKMRNLYELVFQTEYEGEYHESL